MSETAMFKLAGAAMVVWGFKLILFGGSTKTGTYFEIFGFEFGAGEREPMSTFQCWFVGIALIFFGAAILKFSFFP